MRSCDAAHQARPLVGGEIEAAAPLQVGEQDLELGERIRILRRVCSLTLGVGLLMPEPPSPTRVSSSAAMSPRGSTRSTSPARAGGAGACR